MVDDTPLNVKLLADLLGVHGYEVDTAASGAEGLAKVTSFDPDLVLLDVVMPGMSGYEVCRQLRAEPATEGLPVVTSTVCQGPPSVAACRNSSVVRIERLAFWYITEE